MAREAHTPAASALPPVTKRTGRAAGADVVRRQLAKVLASADFDMTGRPREFLRFIVEEALAGRGADLTQAVIATHVFGREGDFDPALDPVVRIQAGRLRRSLERFYTRSGKEDAVRIELPRGAYLPAFRLVALPIPRRRD